MTPKKIRRLVESCYRTRTPLMIHGEPGVGKSAAVEQAARNLAYERKRTFVAAPSLRQQKERTFGFIDIRMAQIDAVDGRGVPYVTENGMTSFATPSMFPREGEGILFLDEFMQAVPLVQNSFTQLIYDRRLGDYEFPEGWAIIMASNEEHHRAGVHPMPTHLLRQWCDYAAQNGVMPEIIAFLNYRPQLLQAFDPKEKSFPSPRAWVRLSKMLKDNFDHGNRDLVDEICEGNVGQGATAEFVAFIDAYHDLPTRAASTLRQPVLSWRSGLRAGIGQPCRLGSSERGRSPNPTRQSDG